MKVFVEWNIMGVLFVLLADLRVVMVDFGGWHVSVCRKHYNEVFESIFEDCR